MTKQSRGKIFAHGLHRVNGDAAAPFGLHSVGFAQQMPGFAVALILVELITGTDSDVSSTESHRGRDYVPGVFCNDVDGEVVEIGLPIILRGAATQLDNKIVPPAKDRGFDLNADEATVEINRQVIAKVSPGLIELESLFGGFRHEAKFGPLAPLFVVADVHSRSFQSPLSKSLPI